MLFVGRVLIGLGVSACLMAGFKACVDWFPRERLPFVNGIQMAAGGLGAMAATAPVEVMAGGIGWRGVFLLLAGLCLLAAASIYFVVPRDREEAHACRAAAEGQPRRRRQGVDQPAVLAGGAAHGGLRGLVHGDRRAVGRAVAARRRRPRTGGGGGAAAGGRRGDGRGLPAHGPCRRPPRQVRHLLAAGGGRRDDACSRRRWRSSSPPPAGRRCCGLPSASSAPPASCPMRRCPSAFPPPWPGG